MSVFFLPNSSARAQSVGTCSESQSSGWKLRPGRWRRALRLRSSVPWGWTWWALSSAQHGQVSTSWAAPAPVLSGCIRGSQGWAGFRRLWQKLAGHGLFALGPGTRSVPEHLWFDPVLKNKYQVQAGIWCLWDEARPNTGFVALA